MVYESISGLVCINFQKRCLFFQASLLVFINIRMAPIKAKKNWNWEDIRYIDPHTEVTCSGGLDGKPEHKPTHMVMGNNDVVLVCPICNTIYGNEERMNSLSVQNQMAEAERRKQIKNNKSLLKVDPSQRINKK
jgi:hypothetical protein